MEYLDKLLKIQKRNKKIIEMRKKGNTFEMIAKKYGITKQRVFAIIKENNELSTEQVN